MQEGLFSLKQMSKTSLAVKLLADKIREAGGRSYLEVVSLDADRELESAEAAVKLDVDCLLGGTRAKEVIEIIRANPIRYFPFPGQIGLRPQQFPAATMLGQNSSLRGFWQVPRSAARSIVPYSTYSYGPTQVTILERSRAR